MTAAVVTGLVVLAVVVLAVLAASDAQQRSQLPGRRRVTRGVSRTRRSRRRRR